MLSRQQVVIMRDIARASQLVQALKELKSMEEVISLTELVPNKGNPSTKTHYNQLKQWLEAEVQKTLMQIRIPTNKTETQHVPAAPLVKEQSKTPTNKVT